MKIKNLTKFQKFEKLLDKPLLTGKEVIEIAKADPANTETILNKDTKAPFKLEHLNNFSSLIIKENLLKRKDIRDWSDKFSKAHPDIHYANRDVHIYYSPTIETAVFKEHQDPSLNFIVQCEGYSRWIVHGLETLLEPRDAIYIPAYSPHQCIPLSGRLSLSFAFWRYKHYTYANV